EPAHDGEGIFQVPPPGCGIEVALRTRPARAPQVGDHRGACCLAEVPAQFSRLVEATRGVAKPVQRYRHEGVAHFEVQQELRKEQFCERGHIIESMAELERFQRNIHRKLVKNCGTGAVKRWWPLLAIGTVDAACFRVRPLATAGPSKRLVATSTRICDAREVCPAAEADRARGVTAAEHATIGECPAHELVAEPLKDVFEPGHYRRLNVPGQAGARPTAGFCPETPCGERAGLP